MVNVRVIEPTNVSLGYKKRVCAYARVSTESDDQLNSYFSQIAYYTDLIGKNGEWEMVGIYADEGITGTDMKKRDEFIRMIEDCRLGKIDKIITKSITRFARNTVEAIKVIRELRVLGISIEFEKEHIDTEIMRGDWTVEVLSAVAQEESISISKNMRWAYLQRMKKGEAIIPRAPYGYRLDENNKLVIEKAEAKLVRFIFDEYLKGVGIYRIVKKLQRRKDANMKVWKEGSVRYMLSNEKYVGDTLAQKYYTTDDFPFTIKLNKGEKDKYYIRDTHEGIISREKFEKVQLLLKIKKSRYKIYSNEKTYTIEMICEECGGKLKHRRRSNNTEYWNCYQHNIDRKKCELKPIEHEIILNELIKMFYIFKKDKDILGEYLDGLKMLQEKLLIESENKYINIEIKELIQQNQILNRLRTKGYIDPAVFIEQYNENVKRLNSLVGKLKVNMSDTNIDEKIKSIKSLIKYIQEQESVTLESMECFESIVKTIKISNQLITIELLGNLKIRRERV